MTVLLFQNLELLCFLLFGMSATTTIALRNLKQMHIPLIVSIGATAANVLYGKNDMNRAAATAAIYLAVIAVMAVSILAAYTILIPVPNPSNG